MVLTRIIYPASVRSNGDRRCALVGGWMAQTVIFLQAGVNPKDVSHNGQQYSPVYYSGTNE